MAEENSLRLYKNSAQDGNPIPLDVLLSRGLIKQDFTATAANGIVIPITDPEPDVLVIYADADYDCLIQLDGNAAIPANGTFVEGLHYIPAGSIKVIDRNGAADFGVVSVDSNAGTIYVECALSYRDTKNIQQHRRP